MTALGADTDSMSIIKRIFSGEGDDTVNIEPKVPLSSLMSTDGLHVVQSVETPPAEATVVTPEVVGTDVVDPDRQLADLTRKIRSAHRKIEKAAHQMVASVLVLGEHLTAARELLSANRTGSYGAFLKKCDIPRTIAHRAVAAYETFGNCPTVERFELSAVHALAAPSTPPSAVTEAIDLAADDIAVDGRTAKQLIAKHKPGKPARNRPEKIVLEVPGGFVIVQPSSDDVDVPAMLKAAYLQLLDDRKSSGVKSGLSVVW